MAGWWPPACSGQYGKTQAALGMIGVSRIFRVRGRSGRHGAAAGACGGARRARLYATEAGETLYRRLGFTPDGAVRQLQGAAAAPALEPLSAGERLRPTGRSDPARAGAPWTERRAARTAPR